MELKIDRAEVAASGLGFPEGPLVLGPGAGRLG